MMQYIATSMSHATDGPHWTWQPFQICGSWMKQHKELGINEDGSKAKGRCSLLRVSLGSPTPPFVNLSTHYQRWQNTEILAVDHRVTITIERAAK